MKIKDTCQCCGKYADWDSSFGLPEFLVCDKCATILRKDCPNDWINVVINIGYIRRKENKKCQI